MLVVFDVMQHIGIVARSDNRRVSKTFGAIADEFVNQLGLDFVFHYVGFHERQQSSKTFFGDVAGILNQIQFFGFFHGTQSLQNRIAFGHGVCGIFFFPPFHETSFTGFGFDGGAIMFVGVDVNRVGIRHQFEQNFFEILQPMHGFDSRNFKSALFGEFFAFPNRNVFAGFLEEQHFFLVFIRSVGKK